MLHRTTIISTLLFFFFINYTQAQEQRFKAGLILGANLSQIDGDLSAGYIKLGLSGGLRGVAILGEKSELSIELLFDQRGSRSQSIFDDDFFPFKITNNYVSVPVVFNFMDWLDESEEYYKLHFHAGASYGRLLNSTVDDEDPNSSLSVISTFFNRDDVALLVGATFYTGPHLAITGRFSRSILPLYENADDGRPSVRSAFIAKQLTLQLLYMF